MRAYGILISLLLPAGCYLVDNPLNVAETDGGSSSSSADASTGGPSSSADTSTGTPLCGDGVVSAPEDCDGLDLAGATCESQGLGGGALACDAMCSFDPAGCQLAAPTLTLGFSQVKRFDFSWAAVEGADYYRLEQSVAPGEPFMQMGGDIMGESISVTMPLHFRYEASYVLRACNAVVGCTDSDPVSVVGSLADAVGYFKASSTPDDGDFFGVRVALSDDGDTLAVSAFLDDSNATGIDGDDTNDDSEDAGAVHVFVRDGMGDWSQQAYIKASNTEDNPEFADDRFGWSIALSESGDTLAVGAVYEDSGRGSDPAPSLVTAS